MLSFEFVVSPSNFGLSFRFSRAMVSRKSQDVHEALGCHGLEPLYIETQAGGGLRDPTGLFRRQGSLTCT